MYLIINAANAPTRNIIAAMKRGFRLFRIRKCARHKIVGIPKKKSECISIAPLKSPLSKERCARVIPQNGQLYPVIRWSGQPIKKVYATITATYNKCSRKIFFLDNRSYFSEILFLCALIADKDIDNRPNSASHPA